MSEGVEGVDGRYAIDRFKEAVFAQIDYYTREYKLSYAELIGQLEFIQICLVQNMSDEEGKNE